MDEQKQRMILFEQSIGSLKAIIHTYSAKEAEKFKKYHALLREFITNVENIL